MAITMDMAAMHTMDDTQNMVMVHIIATHIWENRIILIATMETTAREMVHIEVRTTNQSNNNENRSRF